MVAPVSIPESFGEELERMPLVDHHCHGVLTGSLGRVSFERHITESDSPSPHGTSGFDSMIGIAVRRWCAPVLGLEATATPAAYLDRRQDLGANEVNGRLLRASGVSHYLVDTGFRADEISSVDALAELTSSEVREILRLERVAETLAATGISPATFVTEYPAYLERSMANAVGFKSIAAYRYGLDFAPQRPGQREVEEAAAAWLAAGSIARLTDPVLLRFVIWTAVDLGLPIQFHVGFGDSDIDLHRCNPLLLTEFVRLTQASDATIVLLHCYPFHREAAYLAHIYPHVYFDVGEAMNYVGSRATAVLAEALEVAPFAKLLYSSDAFGLAELHYVGSALFRRAVGSILTDWIASGDVSDGDALRFARMWSHENAERLYGLA